MASIERRTRDGQTRWYARCRDPSGAQLVTVIPHQAEHAAMAKNLAKIIPDVYRDGSQWPLAQ